MTCYFRNEQKPDREKALRMAFTGHSTN